MSTDPLVRSLRAGPLADTVEEIEQSKRYLSSDGGARMSDLVAIADRVIEILSSVPGTKNVLKHDIGWFEKRRRTWSTHQWRVGLVGVTSVGKSALVNAFLGDEILPEAVRPTSNCLMVCSKGSRLQASVYFDGRPKETITDGVKERLAQLADESGNPKNKLNVKEIHVQHPDCMFEDDVLLIDTPGLDAYSLERHEELSMKLFLPTADLVVLVATTKASSDHQNSCALGEICKRKKPLVAIQNKVDAVQPKIGGSGQILKTKEKVLQDHRRRLRRLLKGTGNADVGNAPIVQLSARLSLSEGHSGGRESRLKSAANVIEESLGQLEPRLVSGLLQQVVRQIRALVERGAEGGIEKGRKASMPADGLDVSTAKTKLKTIEADYEKHLDSLWAKLKLHQKNGWDSCAEVLRTRNTDIYSIRDIVERSRSHSKVLQESLLEAFANHSRQIRSLCEALNISGLDMQSTAQTAILPKALPQVIKTKERSPGDKRNGLSRWLGQLLGWKTLIYENEPRDIDVVDRNETARFLQDWLSQQQRWMESYLAFVCEDSARIVAKLRQEIKQKRATELRGKKAQNRRDAIREVSGRLEDVLREAEGLQTKLEESEVKPRRFRPQPLTLDSWTEAGLNPILDVIHRVAGQFCRSIRIALRDAVLEQASGRSSSDAIAIVGRSWDDINEFVREYWPDKLSGECSGAPTSMILSSTFGDFMLAVEPGDKSGAEYEAGVSFLQERRCPVFFLFDIGQPGSSQNSAFDSHFFKNLVPEQPIVWVLQHIVEVISSGEAAIADAAFSFRSMVDAAAIERQGILVDHEDPALTALFCELVLNESGAVAGLKNEARMISELDALRTSLGSTVWDLARVVRYFRELEGTGLD